MASGGPHCKVASRQAGTDYDQLNVSGLATLGGTLELSFLNDYIPDPGQIYELITGPTTGRFDRVIGLPADWRLLHEPTGVGLTIPEPATLSLLALAGLVFLRRRRR